MSLMHRNVYMWEREGESRGGVEKERKWGKEGKGKGNLDILEVASS